MDKCAVLFFALAASSYLAGVDTTPVPPRTYVEDEGGEKRQFLTETKTSLTTNAIRTKRGVPCPCVDDSECEWEKIKPCGCDPCDVLKNANEARILRKHHRKIVAEMKMNRLKRKLHTAVCPPCALAHERDLERELEHRPCTKPHVDVTVVVPSGSSYSPEGVFKEYPMLPPPRPTFSQYMETGSKAIQMEQFVEPTYDEPMVPVAQYEPVAPQYESMAPQYEPMYPKPGQGFGPAVPWMRSSAPVNEDTEKTISVEEVLGNDSKRRKMSIDKQNPEPLDIFPANTTEPPVMDSDEAWPFKNATYDLHLLSPTKPTATEAPMEADDAWPFKNGTYSLRLLSPTKQTITGAPMRPVPTRHVRNATHDETSLVAPPPDALWRAAYLAASKAVASAMNNSARLDMLKPSDDLPTRVIKNCVGGQCSDSELCLSAQCLEKEVRQKRDTSFGMPFASALLTGLVSAIIGA